MPCRGGHSSAGTVQHSRGLGRRHRPNHVLQFRRVVDGEWRHKAVHRSSPHGVHLLLRYPGRDASADLAYADARRTFVVGIAFVFGLSVEVLPGLYQQFPEAIRPLFASALSLTTILAVGLNMLFRIGVARSYEAVLSPVADNFDTISAMMEERGAAWGMRREVCTRVVDALYEFLVAVAPAAFTCPSTTSPPCY